MKPQNLLYTALGFAAGYAIFGNKTEGSMGAITLKDAENNTKNLRIQQTGYGHWKICCDYRGKQICTTTTDSMAIDDYRSEYGEKDGREYRQKRGYTALVNQIIRDNGY